MKTVNRRRFLKTLGVGAASATMLSLTQCQKQPVRKPNIIYIMADDLGYGDLGCYGQEIIKTPNLDKMADEGIRFSRHYAGTSVCAPSRSVLITGKHNGHTQVRGNKQVEPSGQQPLQPNTTTVGTVLQQAGYYTGMIGKWGLGVEGTTGEPTKQGFDYYFGYLDQVLAHNYYPEYLLRNGERVYLDNEVKYLGKDAWHEGLGSYSTKKVDYSHDLFVKDTLKFIDEHKEQTFFLYLPLTIPHNNGEAPDGQKQEAPDYGIYEGEDWPSDHKGYAAMITRMDRDIGVILEKIKALGLDEYTFIIFTSDNGPMQERVGYTKFFDSNGPFRGGKRDLFEGGIRAPMIARWPRHIQPGTMTDHISAFWDVMPTLAEVAGVDAPADTDGISFLPVLLGDEQPEHEYLYWEFHEQAGSQAVRWKKWKGVRLGVHENPDAPILLFDLEADLGEKNNVAAEHPDVVERIAQIMDDEHVPSEVFPWRHTKN